MTTEIKNLLSESALKDLEAYEKSGKDAVWYLINEPEKLTLEQLILRFQTSNIENVIKSGIKSDKEWNNCGIRKTLSGKVEPLTKNGGFSSYALEESDVDMFRFRCPMYPSCTPSELAFIKVEFPTYDNLISKIASVYNIKVLDDFKYSKLFVYKKKRIRSFLKSLKNKSLNLCRKVFKKNIRSYSSTAYAGTVHITDQIFLGRRRKYKISQYEKISKLLDVVLTTKTKLINKAYKVNLSKEEQFASRLLSGILLSRAINYGNINDNRLVESCISLQLSNVLLKLNMSPEKMKDISNVASYTADKVANELGISLEDIKLTMEENGFSYATKPSDIIDALVPQLKNENTIVNSFDSKQVNKQISKLINNNTTSNPAVYGIPKGVMIDGKYFELKFEDYNPKADVKIENNDTLSKSNNSGMVMKDGQMEGFSDGENYYAFTKEDYEQKGNEVFELNTTSTNNAINLDMKDGEINGFTDGENYYTFTKEDYEQNGSEVIANTLTDNSQANFVMENGEYKGFTDGENYYTFTKADYDESLTDKATAKDIDVATKKRPMIKKSKAEEIIDEIIRRVLLNKKDYCRSLFAKNPEKNSTIAFRKYNFYEHVSDFYNDNKNKSIADIKDILKSDFISNLDNDNDIAHDLAIDFIELKQDIIAKMFEDKTIIEKEAGKRLENIINDSCISVRDNKLNEYINYALDLKTDNLTNVNCGVKLPCKDNLK